VTANLSRSFLTSLQLGQHDPSLSTPVQLAKRLRVSVTELLEQGLSASQWWQVGETRFATPEDAEDHARSSGERFVAGYRNKLAGPIRCLLLIRETNSAPSHCGLSLCLLRDQGEESWKFS